jgi:hypothetical protein
LFRNSTERPDELGKTAMLSYLQEDKVNQFVDTYERYITNGLSADESPSRMIVEHLRPFSAGTPAE